nr:MAG TPA: hypothetical protein [Bacteriophage sp.]
MISQTIYRKAGSKQQLQQQMAAVMSTLSKMVQR